MEEDDGGSKPGTQPTKAEADGGAKTAVASPGWSPLTPNSRSFIDATVESSSEKANSSHQPVSS